MEPSIFLRYSSAPLYYITDFHGFVKKYSGHNNNNKFEEGRAIFIIKNKPKSRIIKLRFWKTKTRILVLRKYK